MARHFSPAAESRPVPRPQSRHRGILPILVALLLVVAGGALLLGPAVASVAEQEELLATVSDALADTGSADAGGDATYEALLAYNERVRNGTGDAINDPFAFSGDALDELGLQDTLIGTVDIPALGVTLPLYLGSTYENMARGATVIAGTSMPVGGESTNCVIAAHRGAWSGLQMFRDIELMEVGDTLTITTPWGSLTYEAVEIRVIDPNDAGALAVQEGRDLVTLFTCHPYGSHAQRYLVYCERVGDGEAQQSAGVLERAVRAYLPAPSEGSPSLALECALRLAGLALLLAAVLLLAAALIRRLRGARDGVG